MMISKPATRQKYQKWSEQEHQVMKQELWKQMSRPCIDWSTMLRRLPNRSKQQLISYRNGHKQSLYGSPPSFTSDLTEKSSCVSPIHFNIFEVLDSPENSIIYADCILVP